MLTIKNYTKLEGRLLEFTGGWGVDYCKECEDTYAIGVKHPEYSPIINRKVVHLSRTLESLGNGEWRYFFYHKNKKIEYCVDAEYLMDMNMMLQTLSKIVNKYQ
jgi:hypothetical protein